jgi:type IV secretory pathway VirB2 component (pilin)
MKEAKLEIDSKPHRRWSAVLAGLMIAPALATATWEDPKITLLHSFTGPVGQVLGGVAFAAGAILVWLGATCERRDFPLALLGVGMLLAAINFLAWLFPHH